MCVTEAGMWRMVSIELLKASSPMSVTDAGRWSEAGSKSMNAQLSIRSAASGRRSMLSNIEVQCEEDQLLMTHCEASTHRCLHVPR